MRNEVEILLIEDNPSEAEIAIDILRKNGLANKLVHLRDGTEASQFIFCFGPFAHRNFQSQPKAIIFCTKTLKTSDKFFLNKIAADKLTKEIPLIILASKIKTDKVLINKEYSIGSLLVNLFN